MCWEALLNPPVYTAGLLAGWVGSRGVPGPPDQLTFPQDPQVLSLPTAQGCEQQRGASLGPVPALRLPPGAVVLKVCGWPGGRGRWALPEEGPSSLGVSDDDMPDASRGFLSETGLRVESLGCSQEHCLAGLFLLGHKLSVANRISRHALGPRELLRFTAVERIPGTAPLSSQCPPQISPLIPLWAMSKDAE